MDRLGRLRFFLKKKRLHFEEPCTMLLGPVPSQAEPKDSKKRQCSKLGNRISTIAITPVGLPRLRSPLADAGQSISANVPVQNTAYDGQGGSWGNDDQPFRYTHQDSFAHWLRRRGRIAQVSER